MRSVSLELGIRGFDVAGLSDSQIGDFNHRLSESVRAAERAFKDFKSSSGEKEQEVANKYQDLRTKRASKHSSRETTASNAKRIKERIKQAQDELDGFSVAQADIDAAKEAFEEDTKRQQRVANELKEANYEEQLRKKNTEIRDLDERREELTVELNALNRHAEFRAKLDLKRNEAEEKKSAANGLITRHAAAYKNHTGQDAKLETFESGLAAAQSSKDHAVAGAEREEAEKTRTVQHLESALSIARGQLNDKKGQLARLQKQIREFVAPHQPDCTTVADVVALAEREIEESTAQLLMASKAHDFMQLIQSHLHASKKCVGCNRGVHADELADVEKYVAEKIAAASSGERTEIELGIEQWKGTLSDARVLIPTEETTKKIEATEIPKLEQDIERQTAELTKKSEEAEKASSVVRVLKDEQRELASLKRVAQDISRLISEGETLRKEVANLEGDLASYGSTQTGDQVQAAINDLAESIRKLKREANIVQANRDSKRNDLSAAERQVYRSQQAVAQKEQENQRRLSLQQRVDELKAEHSELTDAQKKLDEEIDALASPIRKTKDELESLKEEHAAKERQLDREMGGLQSKARTIKETSDAVQRYIDGRGAQRLSDCE